MFEDKLTPQQLADLVNDPDYAVVAGFVKGVDEEELEAYLLEHGVTLTDVGAIPTSLLEDL